MFIRHNHTINVMMFFFVDVHNYEGKTSSLDQVYYNTTDVQNREELDK